MPEPAPAASAGWAVDTVSPYVGVVGAPTTVQLTGTFPGPAYVWFGTVPGTVLSAGDDALVVLAPASDVAGPVDITLRRTGAGVVLTVADGFTRVAASPSAGSGASGSDATTPAASATAATTPAASATAARSTAPTSAGSSSGGAASSSSSSASVGAAGGGSDPAAADPVTDPVADGNADAPAGPASAPRDRFVVAPDARALGNGLRGVRVGGEPLHGATVCTANPCVSG